MVELFENLLELASQPHNNCSGDYCEAEGYGDGNIKEHLILDRAEKMLAEGRKYESIQYVLWYRWLRVRPAGGRHRARGHRVLGDR